MDASFASAVPSVQRVAAHQVVHARCFDARPNIPSRVSSMSIISEGAEFASSGGNTRGEPVPSIAGVGDYLALMKPRVMSLVVFTALVGLMLAPGHIHPVIAFTALLCISTGAGAAAALNMWYDADIDAVMTRTSSRPIPRGRIAAGEALGFGMTLAGFSVAVLGLLGTGLPPLCWGSPSFFMSLSIRYGSSARPRRTSSLGAQRELFHP